MKWEHVLGTAWSRTVAWVRQESAAAATLVLAFIALGIAFEWWHWSNAQTGAVVGITAALLGMFVRSQVTPIARARVHRRVTPAEPPSGPPSPPGPSSPSGPSGPPPGPPPGSGTLPL